MYNPNIVSDEYSGRFSEAEIQSIAILSDLIGYDPQLSGGLFTFGGTGTILYGCKLGIEKILGGEGYARKHTRGFQNLLLRCVSLFASYCVSVAGIGNEKPDSHPFDLKQ